MSSVVAIRAIGVMFAGLVENQFVLKFIEG